MELLNAYKGTKIIEAIENYSIADNHTESEKENLTTNYHLYLGFHNDGEFWSDVIYKSDDYWNKPICLYNFVVSDWVARVPGLYWARYSSNLRNNPQKQIAFISETWVEYNPTGKSKKVLGGIGTILLPPNDEGKRLISVSSSYNASLGVPALVFPNVFESLNIKQGDVVDIINAKWQPLDVAWAKRFASTVNIPRGYLVVDTPDKIIIKKKNAPVVYHPFSIMEYQSEDALLYDFVYMEVDNKTKGVRMEIAKFFDYYAKKENRNGRYLLNSNMVKPMFDALYNSPEEMRSPTERANLELMKKRISEVNFNKTTLNKLIQLLPKYYDSSIEIKRLAKYSGVSRSLIEESNAASMSAQLINHCMDVGKIEELCDRIIVEYPEIFK